MKKKAKIIFGVMFFAMLIGNYFQYQLSPIAGRLMESMHLSQTQFSSVFSAPMIPAIVLSIAAGVMADRFGVKKSCGIAILAAAVGLCIRPFAQNYKSLLTTMILAGIGTTFINVNVAKIMGRYYPPEKIGTMVGMVMMGSSIGMTLATSTTAAFPSIKIALSVAAFGEVLLLVFWFLFMDSDAKEKNKKTEETQESVITSVVVVLKSKNIWLIGICMMCILGCNTALGSFVPIALQSKGISETTAGLVVTGLMVGSFVGTFAGPRIVAGSKNKKIILAALSILSAITAAVSWQLPTAAAFIGLLLCGFGMGALLPVFMSMPMQLKEIGPIYAGTAGGVVSTMELLGAVMIPTYIITPIAGSNYTVFFALSGACMVCMAVAALFLPND